MAAVVHAAERARSTAWLAGYGSAWTNSQKPRYSKADAELGNVWDEGRAKGLAIKAEIT